MKERATEIAGKHLGMSGRMISASKSGYLNHFPDNLVIFNANVCTEDGKIWFGDIDITLSYKNLSDLSKELNQILYVLREMDGRFENESSPRINRAVVRFFPEGGHKVDELIESTRKINIENQ